MASRQGSFPPTSQARKHQPQPQPPSMGSSNTTNILKNFRHEDVVYALMTQLREKESQLTMLSEQSQVALRHQQITEQTNMQLKSRIDVHNRAMAEKDTRIAVLEHKLAQQMKGNGSAIAEANLKHLSETNTEHKRVLQERDDELSQLRPILRELKEKVDQYESKATVQHSEKLEAELSKVKEELAVAENKCLTSNSTVDELEKKIKGKEWMIKSLQEESDDQRSRENHLLAHIKKLDETIETYETKFKGRGVDVPMLLAKLKDYEARTKDLQGQIRRLTNKKLNELVLRSSPVPHQEEENKEKQHASSKRQPEISLEDEGENESEGTDNYSFLIQDSEEDATFATNATDEEDNPFEFASKSHQEEDVLSDFLTDVKVGIQTLEMESICCAQRPMSPPTDYHRKRSIDNSSRS